MLKDLKIAFRALKKIGADSRSVSLFEQLLRDEEMKHEKAEGDSASPSIRNLSQQALEQQNRFNQLMHEIITNGLAEEKK
jgi:hypothetical protein